MMFRKLVLLVAVAALALSTAQAGVWPFHHKKKNNNPLANLNSKQPDKVLFDRGMDAMGHNKFDVARLSFQTLINTYPDSEYVARAKLGIGDAWYKEGGTTALAQAEIEYKDFITFFPNMAEAAEAQMKVANIHYRQMDKADRDPTQALRAEEEYRQLILQFPDSKLVPVAQQRLREVQEVLARREYDIGYFYYVRESWPAAIARLKSVADTYPLFSQADDALFYLGSSCEREMDAIRHTRLNEAAKGRMISDFKRQATVAYDRILTRYPLSDRADDVRHRLRALGEPAPTPTAAEIAENKAEKASRSETGMFGRVMGNFHHGPDVAEAAKVGQPTLNDPEQTSAVQVVRQANADMLGGATAGGSTLTLTTVSPANATASQPVPRSEPNGASAPNNTANAGANDEAAIQTLGGNTAPVANQPTPGTSDAASATAAGSAPAGDSAPQASTEATNGNSGTAAAANTAPVPPPAQVNDANASADGSANPAAASGTSKGQSQTGESTSKKKKKHGLRKLIPF